MVFLKKLFNFYRNDCCWPYALSFYLLLIIYWLDFITPGKTYHLSSYFSYAVVLAYYFYIVYRYFKKKITDKNEFFIKFLSLKIIIWGILLMSFCLANVIETVKEVI